MRCHFIAAAASLFLAACSEPALVAANAAGTETDTVPERSEIYRRVDRSFSDIPVETVLADVEHRLERVDEGDCMAQGECQLRDASGVQHHFWTDGHDEPRLAIKILDVAGTRGRPVAAIGIGIARDRQQVLDEVRAFAPELDWVCQGHTCSAEVLPGWVTLRFSDDGALQQVRFDASHFV